MYQIVRKTAIKSSILLWSTWFAIELYFDHLIKPVLESYALLHKIIDFLYENTKYILSLLLQERMVER